MSEFTKKCKRCGKEFHYENHDELSQWFYKKDNYYLNTCKPCELEKHAIAYKSGKYRNGRRDRSYDPHDYRGV